MNTEQMQNNENRWKYEKVDINLIDEAEANANKMTDEDFNALCDNIGISGMSSTPCCYKKSNGRFVMISGHHRLRACKKLHYKSLGILWCSEEELSRDEIIAIQLSHNSLHGEDDRSILRKLFEQIQSIDFKQFAHININEISPIESRGLDISVMKENYTFSVVLYNNSKEHINDLLTDIRELAPTSDMVIIADGNPTESLYLGLASDIRKGLKIKSSNLRFAKILELAYKQLQQELNESNNN